MQNLEIHDALKNFAGGEYDQVQIHGIASSDDDVTCTEMTVHGMLKVGAVTAGTLQVFGMLKADGAISADRTEIPGNVKTDKDMQTGELNVPGSLAVCGSLVAKNTSVPGNIKCEGSAVFGDLNCPGNLKVSDTITARSVNIPGTVKTGAHIVAESIVCSGMIKAEAGITSNTLTLDGYVKTQGNIEAEQISCSGQIHTSGQISADRIEITGQVRADEIVGDHIEIRNECTGLVNEIMKDIMSAFFGKEPAQSTKYANLIEATTIILEGVTAGTVSGENVTIGEHCQIERVDCTGNLTIDPTSTVQIVNGEPYAN